MQIDAIHIHGVFIITPKVLEDDRGFLMETYRYDLFREAGIDASFVQDHHSLSFKRNTVRGLNFQWEPPMGKIMRVTRGEAFLVAVDIRKKSPTFGQWFGFVASERNKKQLYAPAGFARGFQTITDMTEVQYKDTAFYNKEGEGTLLWNDEDIGVDWPIKETPILSERNRTAPTLKEWLKRPESGNFIF